MFLDRTVPQISQNWERFEFVRDGKAQLGAAIQRAIDAGHFRLRHRHTRSSGFSSRQRRARRWLDCVDGFPGEDSDALARDTLEAALTGLRTGFPATFGPTTYCGESLSDQN